MTYESKSVLKRTKSSTLSTGRSRTLFATDAASGGFQLHVAVQPGKRLPLVSVVALLEDTSFAHAGVATSNDEIVADLMTFFEEWLFSHFEFHYAPVRVVPSQLSKPPLKATLQ